MNATAVDVLVIGAGPSGTVAASIIHQAGYSVRIVERELFPRFVIGESLLPKCMEPLEEAGFLPALRAHGFQEKFGAKFVNVDKQVMDFNFDDQFTKGWNWTWQVQRADFDSILAHEVARMGVTVSYQTTVTNIVFDGSHSTTTVTNADGSETQIRAKFIVDGSGYGRVIPRMFDMERASHLPPRRTLFAHIRDTRRMNYVEPNRILIVDHAPGVWVWCIPFSDGTTSCGFVGNPDFFESLTGNPEDMLRTLIASDVNIAERFEGNEFLWSPRSLQAWSATCDRFYGEGFVLTGNVTEFLDPIFSSGVTLATVSSQTAAHLVIKHLQGEAVNWERDYQQRCMTGVEAFRTYVMAWYDGTLQRVFFSDRRDPIVVSQICSVLAGYVWDMDNPFVYDSRNSLDRLIRLIGALDKIEQR